MQKILFIIGSLTGGGAERVTALIASSLASEYEVELATGSKITKEDYTLDNLVKRTSLNFNYSSKGVIAKVKEYVSRLLIIRRHIIKENIGCVIGVCTSDCIRAVLASVNSNSKVIVSEHNNYYAIRSIFLRFMRNLVYFFADEILVLTKRDINNYPFYLRSKITVMKNPIPIKNNIEISRPNRNALKFLHIGRLVEQKNQKELIEIIHELSISTSSDFFVDIVGEGPLRYDLERSVENFNLSERVRFHPFTNDISQYYSSADFLLLTSHYEGLPMVILEALSFGVPVIAYNCPTGISELIHDRYNGYVIKHYDKKDFIEKLKIVLDEMLEFEYIAMSKNCVHSIQFYSVEKVTEKWISIISRKNNR